MKVAAHVILALTVCTCLGALAISVYPGVLNDLLFVGVLLSILVVPVVVIVSLVGLIVLWRRGKLQRPRIAWPRTAVLLFVVIATSALLEFYVPRRIAFRASRAAFERMLPQAMPLRGQDTPFDRRLGLYKVDAYAADPRGGVYFRVHIGPDGISPDRMSYGFVYKPNPNDTPFGAAWYRTFHLENDWYWFRASDDWY